MRWTQLDPSGQDKGYLYAGDNPVNFSDPSGLALTQPYLVNATKSNGTVTGIGPSLETNIVNAFGGPCQASFFAGGTGAGIGAGLLLAGPETLGTSIAVRAVINFATQLIGTGVCN